MATAPNPGMAIACLQWPPNGQQEASKIRGGLMKRAFFLNVLALCPLVALSAPGARGDEIPKVAWRRPLGLPLENPGVKRGATDIDDGYWQGAPVGGFGSGTFSRTYRGDFARWHIKAGVHKYETVYANEFAMFQQAEGDAQGRAQVLMTDHPHDGQLSSWKWGYPVGAGEYAALYPKSWFDYKWDKFPAHVVLEQFSPVLPENYRESSYPVAVYRWHAENPTEKKVTVSVLLSWTNMAGYFRTFTRDFKGAPSQGNRNRFASEAAGQAGTVKGVIFERNHADGRKTSGTDSLPSQPSMHPASKSPIKRHFSATETGRQCGGHFRRMEGSRTAIRRG
jgi:non-lysosomal glucosylceramidase